MALFKRKNNESNVKVDKTGEQKQSQLQVLKDAYRLTKKEKPAALPLTILIFVITLVLGILVGSSLGHPVYFGIIAVPLSVLVAFFFFTRQANSAAFLSIQGQIGAGASVLMAIRRGFTTTPAVNVSRNQDMVHRTVGRAGIILVGEGTPAVKQLLSDELRKTERFVPGVPVTTVIVGEGEGRVSLRKLQGYLKKLPKKLSKNQLREVRNRLKAVGGLNIPIPKGPMPKNVRMPRR
jgi:Domain of unknown function (DUF4191)